MTILWKKYLRRMAENDLFVKIEKYMQKFLGLANYYRQFVKDFTRVAKLHKITRKDVKWN